LFYLTKIAVTAKEKKLLFPERLKKDNLPDFKNFNPSNDSQSYHVLNYI
jgi:hypothetical protein